MLGQMMSKPLLTSSLIGHADRWHGDTEIVSRKTEGGLHRYTYREAHARARQLANALKALGAGDGTRVATLAWNNFRHFEAYYAISGIGAVTHTINPRLFPEQVTWIINDAEDAYVLFDLSFLKLVEGVAPLCKGVKGWIAMTDRSHMPESSLKLLCYEEMLAAQTDQFEWPAFDENTAACLCYTSGTTGNPKGALYSHRSSLLHTYSVCMPDGLSLSAVDVVLPVVPLFHVNAWGIPYACAMTGAKLVMPGPNLDGASLYELFETEKVTLTAGVPTIWLALLQYMDGKGLKLSTMKRIVIGGSAAPPAMIAAFGERYGVDVLHAWGMTEMSPLGTANRFKLKHAGMDATARDLLRRKQGRPLFGVDLEIVDDGGKPLPHDGKAFGDLVVKGFCVIDKYFKGAGGEILRDGWFPTGDVATVDADGYIQITDRSKDVIKSGGEWISSIDLENAAVAHPAVMEAAVIGIKHPKWDERPLLIVVKKPGQEVTKEAMLGFLAGKVAKWWLPDDVVFVETLPHTATGKLSKLTLRQQFADYRFPGA